MANDINNKPEVKTITKFIWSERVLDIMNDKRMTKREQVGHMENLTGRTSWSPEAIEKLEKLLKWATGKNPPEFTGRFDMDTRVFTLSFKPEVYFKKGGMAYHNEVLQFFNRMKWPYISYTGASFWVGYFPHFIKEEVKEEVAKPVQQKPVEVRVQEPVVEEQAVKVSKPKAAPKTVRNMKRKPKPPEFTQVPVEEQEEDDERGW